MQGDIVRWLIIAPTWNYVEILKNKKTDLCT